MWNHVRRAFSTQRALYNIKMYSDELPAVFLPPVNRSMNALDKSFFRKTISLAVAKVSDAQQISTVRDQLRKSNDLLQVSSIKPLRPVPNEPIAKYFLLHPDTKSTDESTWSATVTELVKNNQAQIQDYDLTLTYDDWTMYNILDAILPELPEDEKETPAGFAQVGHVAHVNLRNQYLPYKYLIGQVLLDKNPKIKTVINKTLDVGSESEFRTFPYEVLAGPDDLDVTVHDAGCTFRFNYGKVYWNTRLSTEHARIVDRFAEGESVCDVMAGVGPFAIPAGKKRVFVHANDLNPASYHSLEDAIRMNHVRDFVSASCEDGRAFIRRATAKVFRKPRRTVIKSQLKPPRTATKEQRAVWDEKINRDKQIYQEPSFVNHFVMNLPAKAIEFLDAFKGIYHGRETEFAPHTEHKLSMIHLYLFQTRCDDDENEHKEICQRISQHIGAEIQLDNSEHELEIRNVRLVSPKKRMYCASFRLSASVAFAEPEPSNLEPSFNENEDIEKLSTWKPMNLPFLTK